MRFSTETELILKDSDWHPGRVFEVDQLGDEIPSGSPIVSVLQEFGGLVIGSEELGIDCRRHIVDFRPSNWDFFDDGYFDDDGVPRKYLSLALARVGWLETYNSSLLMDLSGVAYFSGEWSNGSGCYKYPAGIDSLLEHLLLGSELTGEVWSYGMLGEILLKEQDQ